MDEIHAESTVFLDASSTCLAVAKQLARLPATGVTVVTNSPAIAYLVRADHVSVVVCPGELDQRERVLAGPRTVDFLAGLNFELALFSGAGLTLESGLAATHPGAAEVIQAACARARRRIAVADSEKFGRHAPVELFPLRSLTAVVTDSDVDADVAQAYRAADVELRIAALNTGAVGFAAG